MKFFKSIFQLPSAQTLAKRELAKAQRELLVAQSTNEYSRRMVEFRTDQVRRLTAYVQA